MKSCSCEPSANISQLDSSFFLNWASYLLELKLSNDCYFTPGIRTLLRTCTKLQRLQLSCTSMMQAVEADRLMQHCVSLQELAVSCTHVPFIPILTIRSLHVQFLGCYGVGDVQVQHNTLLCRCILLRHLQRLHLEIVAGPIHLACSANLPSLQHISLTFSLSKGTNLQFSWLRHQTCLSLDMRICIRTSKPAAHERMLAALLGLPITRLTLSIAVEVPAKVQRLWKELAARDHVQIEVEDGCCPADAALHALPRSPLTCIQGSGNKAVYVAWEALTAHSCQIDMTFADDQDLVMLGGPQYAHLREPWQVVVHAAGLVHGMDHTRVVGSRLIAQNPAARAAGWTADISESAQGCLRSENQEAVGMGSLRRALTEFERLRHQISGRRRLSDEDDST